VQARRGYFHCAFGSIPRARVLQATYSKGVLDMEKEIYYLLAITISIFSALISVIAAFNTFKFSKAAKEAAAEKFDLDRTKYKPFFQATVESFKYNSEERQYEGKVKLTNIGETIQQLDRIGVGGSAELIPIGTYIISTPQLLKNRISLNINESHSIEFVLHTWDVKFKEAQLEVLINTSNSYTFNESLLLDCGKTIKDF
jgi:hypothetical protein